MSVPRNSDVSKHLARVPRRTGIVLPFPASVTPNREDQMDEVSVTIQEKRLVDGLQATNKTIDSEPLLETR